MVGNRRILKSRILIGELFTESQRREKVVLSVPEVWPVRNRSNQYGTAQAYGACTVDR